jgi:cell division protein FtsL
MQAEAYDTQREINWRNIEIRKYDRKRDDLEKEIKRYQNLCVVLQ